MGLARLISHAFNPAGLALVVFLVWGMLFPTDWTSVGIGLCFYVVLPTLSLFYLLRSGRIDALYPARREERNGLLLVGLACYTLGYIALVLMGSSALMCSTGLSFSAATLCVWLINRHWKISIHCVGVGGATFLLCYVGGKMLWPGVFLIPLVAWARLKLLAHTPLQLVAGFLLGGVVSLLAYAAHAA